MMKRWIKIWKHLFLTWKYQLYNKLWHLPFIPPNQIHLIIQFNLQSFEILGFVPFMHPFEHSPLALTFVLIGPNAFSNNYMVFLHIFRFFFSTTPTSLSTQPPLNLSHAWRQGDDLRIQSPFLKLLWFLITFQLVAFEFHQLLD